MSLVHTGLNIFPTSGNWSPPSRTTPIAIFLPQGTWRYWTILIEAPNWQPGLTFVLHTLAEQMWRRGRKVERKEIVLTPLPELSLQIVKFAWEPGRVTMANAITTTCSNRYTLKQHCWALLAECHFANGLNTCLLKLRQLAEAMAQSVASRVELNVFADEKRISAPCVLPRRQPTESRTRWEIGGALKQCSAPKVSAGVMEVVMPLRTGNHHEN